MRVLVTTMGAAGDHLPILGVARALAARGHGVVCALDDPWRSRSEALGLATVALGGAAPEGASRAMHRPLEGSIAFLRRMVIPRVPEMVRSLECAARELGADVILGHHISLGGPWAAERLGIGWAMAAVAPASWTSLEQLTVYPGMPDRERYNPAVMRVAVGAGKWATSALTDPGLNRARREFGLPPQRGAMFREMFSGVANLGLWSPVFRPMASDDAPRSVVCGFVRPPPIDADDGVRSRVAEFLGSNGPAVVFTLGTSVPHAAERFFAEAAAWARRTGRPAVLLTGSAGESIAELPPNAVAASFVPLDDVLSNASCIVHHGGLGTIGYALRAGVPMVCVPHLHDQFDNAARGRRLGVSVTVSRKRLSAVGEAVERVTADPTFADAATRVRAMVANEDGAVRAAEALELALGDPPRRVQPVRGVGEG